MTRTLLAGVGLVSLLAVSPALAQEAGPRQDLRCMLTMAAMASNPKLKEPALLGVYYYAGRLRSKNPTFDIEGGLKATAKQMTLRDFRAEARACSSAVTEIAAALAKTQTALKDFKPAP